MKLVEKFPTHTLERITYPGGFRQYICPTTKEYLPSVTSVLDRTADKTALHEWRRRVGEDEANRISREATGLGSLMHNHLECYIRGTPRPTGNNVVRLQAEIMADRVIEHGMPAVAEVWACEVPLWYPKLYAGTSDAIGLYEGEPAILDFKTARKMKRVEYIQDYFLQVTAYALAANELYNLNIKTGVIFMVDREFNFQKFVIAGNEFAAYTDKFLDRLDRYLEVATPIAA